MLELYEQRLTTNLCILLTRYDYSFDRKAFGHWISIQTLSREFMR